MLAFAFLVVAAAPAGKADVLVLDLKAVGVDAAEARIVDGFVAEAVGKVVARWPASSRPRVATGSDLRTLVTIDASKAANGCDDAGCMAEIAGALGARYVVAGTLGKLGDDRVLQLSLYDVSTGEALDRESTTAPSSRDMHLDALATRVMAPLAPAVHDEAAPLSALLVGGAVTGGLGGAVAVAAGVVALVLDARLAAGSGAAPADKRQALQYGPAVVVATAAGAVVATAGLVVAGIGAATGGAE